MHKTTITFTLTFLLGFARALAGYIEIERSVNGAAFMPYGMVLSNGVPVDVTVSGAFGDDEVVFRFRDFEGGIPDDSIRSITVNGSINEGEVRLLVAGGITNNPVGTWPAVSTDDLVSGVLHFGVANTSAIVFESPELEAHSRIAVAVAGNVYGNVRVGRVTRIQAFGRNNENNQLIDGVISGNITSTLEDQHVNAELFPPVWFRHFGAFAVGRALAIERIECNTLTGTVRAEVPENFNAAESIYEHNASIGSILVGQLAPPSGEGFMLSGDILAPAGRIELIQVGCPIKPATVEAPAPRLWAGNGVWEVKTFLVGDLPRDVDVHAHIKTAWQEAIPQIPQGNRFAPPPAVGLDEYGLAYPDGNQDPMQYPTFEQALRRLEIGGDFVGIIEAKNIAPYKYLPIAFNLRAIGWWGITVGGSFTGKISVQDRVLCASIMAQTFIDSPPVEGEAMITIGTFLKGSIVATSPTGDIPALSVGRHSLVNGVDGDDRHGFIGSHYLPAAVDDDPRTNRWYDEGQGNQAGQQEPDTIVRAHTIGPITLSGMNYGNNKVCPPRIEAPSIASLTVDEALCGIVWSGVREVEPEVDFRNDFATVGHVLLGCVEDGVELWLNTNALTATGNFAGRLHMAEVGPNAIIKFGNFHAASQVVCVPFVLSGVGFGNDEVSPRNAWLSSEYNLAGIRIAQEGGLHGQIITGTAQAASWTGIGIAQSVFVGSPNPAAMSANTAFGPQENPDPQVPLRRSPYYWTTSEDLGGGAIGELPFGLHPIDSVPDHSSNSLNPRPHSRGGLASGDQPWTLAFYGPITFANTPVSVEFLDLTQQPPDWVGVTEAFAFAVSANGRDLELRGDGEPALAVGKYRVQPTSALLCNVDGAMVRVADFPGDGWSYIIATCTLMSGSLNPGDLTDVGNTGAGPDGQLTLDDILLFVNSYSEGGNCPGTPPCNPADVTDVGDTGAGPDGQLTLDDILLFVNSYGEGCFGGA